MRIENKSYTILDIKDTGMESITPIALRITIASLLRKRILSGEIKSGEELSLTGVAEELGISRTPVREAFQSLENDGLISLRMNKGAIVNQIDEKFITDHFEMRMLLESEAAMRAAKNGMDSVDALIKDCEKLRDDMQSGTDSLDYDELNQRIHASIWKAADNKKLNTYLMSLWNGPSIGQNTNSFNHHFLSNIEHIEILTSIKHHDAAGAKKGMERHISRSMENILRSYKEEI